MAATLMQLRRLVRSRLGIPIADDFFTDRVIDDAVNVAVQTLDSETRWPWSEESRLVSITPAAPDITPPANWRATRAVFCGDQELIYVSPADAMRWLMAEGATPLIWSPMSGAIAIRPKTTNEIQLTHFFYVQSAWLKDDEDVPLIPEQYGGAIVAKASELLATRESSGGDATRHGAEYVAWVARMRRDVRNATGPTRTRVRPGSWI